MRKHFSRIFVMALLLIKAATIVIPNYSMPLLLTAAIPLVVLGVVLFINRDDSFSSQLHWVAIVTVLTSFVLPLGPVTMSKLEDIFSGLLEAVSDAAENQWFVIASVVLIGLQLLFRKRTNILFVIGRYAVALSLIVALRNVAFPYSDTYQELIIFLTILCMVRELNGCMMGKSTPSMLRCILMVLFLLAVGNYGGRQKVADGITELLQMDGENWMKTTLAAFVLGLLVLQDDYHRCEKDISMIIKTRNVGWVILIWCLMVVVMNIWKPFFHSGILFIGVPLISVMANSLIQDIGEKGLGWSGAFASVWAFLGLMLLMLAKSINLGLLLRYTLVALLLLVWLSWRKIVVEPKLNRIAQVMGISAILIIATMKLSDIQQLQETPAYLLGLAISCLIWCLLCGHQAKLEDNVSVVYEKEFLMLSGIQLLLVMLLLLIAITKVLFVL